MVLKAQQQVTAINSTKEKCLLEGKPLLKVLPNLLKSWPAQWSLGDNGELKSLAG